MPRKKTPTVDKHSLQIQALCTLMEYTLDCMDDVANQMMSVEKQLQQIQLIQELQAQIIKSRVLSSEEYERFYRQILGVEGPVQ